MSDPTPGESASDAAERAAASGDFDAAEGHLRDAARWQEVALGPHHVDLANTLNNLGIVCEKLGKDAEAEAFFRRACAIATSTLPADHILVMTSRSNLQEFCAARGLLVEGPSPPVTAAPATPVPPTPAPPIPAVPTPELSPAVRVPPAVEPPRAAPPTTLPPRRPDRPSRPQATTTSSQPAPRTSTSSRLTVAAIIVGALVVLAIVLARWSSGDTDTRPIRADEPVSTPPASTATPPPAASTPPVPKAPDEPVNKAPAPPAAPDEPKRDARRMDSALVVVDARLCRTLSTDGWRCEPPGEPVEQGRLAFYTRLRSSRDTSVEHRWYHGTQLRQAVELEVRANTSAGYRTYSRQTIDERSTGDWRLELRSADGVVLHEERFVVR